MRSNRYRKIEEARQILGLGEEATRDEIRSAFRELSREYHPDRCRDGELPNCRQEFEKIVRAREILERYCENYRYSFREGDIRRQPPGRDLDDHLDRFYGNSVV